MVVRLWVPITQRLVARNWNFASSGLPRTASMVPKRFGTSTPLRLGVSVVVTVSSLVACDPGPDAGRSRMRDREPPSLEKTWRGSGETGHDWPVIFEFDDFELDTERFELRRSGRAVHVEPQVFDVLRYLVDHRD